jgi:hydrogenase maturation protein HypF
MWEEGKDWRPPFGDAGLAAEAWRKRVGTYQTSSAGRLFDAAAALVLGICKTSFEGEGPMLLESIAKPGCDAIDLPLGSGNDGILHIDWEPLLDMLADDSVPAATRSGIFHEAIAQAIVSQAMAMKRAGEYDVVGLTGGVFQNKFLCERVSALLEAKNIPVLQHRTVPANDGGLAFGQIIEYIHSDPDIANS